MIAVVAMLAALLLAATLGEGGAAPNVLLATHLLALAAGGFAWVAPGAGAFRADRAARGAFAAFAGLAVASAAAAPYGYAALLTLVEIAAVALVAFAASRSGPALAGRLSPVLALGALAHAGVAIGQRLLADDARPASSFLNPNHLASWLVAAGCVVAGRLAAGGGARFAPLGAASLVASAVAFVLVGSRGASVGASAGIAAGLVLLWPALAPRARRLALAAALAAAVLGAAGIAWRFRVASDPFAFQRVDIWKASLAAGLEHPWLGLGPGQFFHESRHFNFPLEGETLRYARYFPSPHSDAVRAAAEFGLPAALALVAGVGFLLLRVWRRRREGSLDPASAGAAAALAALAAQGMVDDLTGRPALYLLAAALAGSLAGVPAEPRSGPSRRAWLAAGAGALVLWAVVDLAPWLSWREQRGLPRGVLSDPGRERLERALAWNPYHPDLHLREAEDLAGRAPRWSPEQYARAEEAAATAARLSPRDPRYARALARIEATACRTLFPFVAYREQVARRYGAAIALDPHDPMPALEAATFLLGAGDPAGAEHFAGIAVEVEPRASLPRLVLADALAAGGDRVAARREFDTALDLEKSGAAAAGESAYHAALLRLPPERVEAVRRRVSDPVGLAPGLEHQDVPEVVVPVPPSR